MVSNPGTPAGPGGLRLLNQPRPAAVETTTDGAPAAVVVQGRYQQVRAIHQSWRIDDEWWRDEIARRYFSVELVTGRRLTLYRDLIGGGWFQQGYDGPRGRSSIVKRR